MPIKYNPFYKAVVLNIGLIETVITEERHFPDRKTAESFKAEQDRRHKVTVIVRID